MARVGSAPLALAASVALAACAPAALPPPGPAPVVTSERPAIEASRMHALLLNGGGTAAINYQSHLLNLDALRRVLLDAGLAPAQIDVLSGDGDDPAPDLAVRDGAAANDRWLLEGTRLEGPLGSPLRFVSSTLAGARLGPATRQGLAAWFEGPGRRLGEGDTLLLFVTDHGTKGPGGPSTNAITLWGADEKITAEELTALVATLDPGVRVVALMSQCFSGGFASLSDLQRATTPHPTVCGYFSSTADRPAYGCFPENLGDDSVGHAFDFTRALAATRRMDEAHAQVVRGDLTPDVPLRTSDIELDRIVRAAASDRATPFPAAVDAMIQVRWRDAETRASDAAELDRIAASFGLPSPRGIGDLVRVGERILAVEGDAAASANAWSSALGDATSDNLGAFLAAHPAWVARLAEPQLAVMGAAARGALSEALLAELGPFTRAGGAERLDVLHAKAEAASDAAYRMETRRAALLRMQAALTAMAGRAYLASGAAEPDRLAYEALVACEEVTLPGMPRAADVIPPRSKLPSLEADEALARALHPAWIGIAFADLASEARRRLGLPDGASMVSGIYPDSPARAAGLEVGDIIVGAGGQPFGARRGIRSWTMLQSPDTTGHLDVLRGEQRITLAIVPKSLPEKRGPLPVAPAAPIDAPAPAISLRYYRGALAPGKAHLFYFWATWCKPCKAALPELLAYERATGTQVVAITDEDTELLDGFFKTFAGPFPKAVAVDELRRSFATLGASGTPTFVLVDERGVLRSRQIGYTRGRGLGVAGWAWKGK